MFLQQPVPTVSRYLNLMLGGNYYYTGWHVAGGGDGGGGGEREGGALRVLGLAKASP